MSEAGFRRWLDAPWKTGLLIFAVALIVRLVYLGQVAGTPFLDERALIVDAQYYDARAREIAGGQWWLEQPGLLSPLYCYALGLVYAISGSGVYAAKLCQVVIGALSCVLLYLIGRRVFTESVGWLAGAMLAFYAPHIYYHGVLLPPTLVVFLHLMLVSILVGRLTLGRAALAGVVIGLAVLAKANAILLVPVLGAVLIWFVRVPGEGRGRRLIAAGTLAVAALATLVPITVANYRLTDAVFLVTTTGGSNLLKGNGPTATGSHAFLPTDAQATGIRAHLDGKVHGPSAIAQSRKLSARARKYMLDNPGRTALLMVRKLLLLLNRDELGIRDQYYFAATRFSLLRWPLLSFALVVPLGLAGAILGWRRERAVLYAVLAVQVASFVLIFVLARYRLVMVALLMPFAARLVLDLVDGVRRRAWGSLAAPLAVLAVTAALVFLPVGGFPRQHGWADQYRFLGDAYLARGELEAASASLEAALESGWTDPRLTPVHRAEAGLSLADVRIRQGRTQQARDLLEPLAAQLNAMPMPFRARLQTRARELARRLPSP